MEKKIIMARQNRQKRAGKPRERGVRSKQGEGAWMELYEWENKEEERNRREMMELRGDREWRKGDRPFNCS